VPASTGTVGVAQRLTMAPSGPVREALRMRPPADDSRLWSRYALVLVDLQRDFWDAATAAAAPELPDRVAGLLAFARAERITVIHVRARFRPDGRDWMARYRLRNWIPCIDGSPGAETLAFATELPGEPVVVKQSFDGFLGTDLDEVLAERGIRGLLVAGLVTSTCVLFTASTATQRGYLVSVVSDCCSDREELHDATLAAYPFVFDTVLSEQIAARRDGWDADLDRMDTLPT
jgi:nicotinamidase-related amidase